MKLHLPWQLNTRRDHDGSLRALMDQEFRPVQGNPVWNRAVGLNGLTAVAHMERTREDGV